MLKLIILVVAFAVITGIGWPLVSSAIRGGDDEATRLVEAADRTQNKAQSLSHSYNELIPPKAPETVSPAAREGVENSPKPADDRDDSPQSTAPESGGNGDTFQPVESELSDPVGDAESLLVRLRGWLFGHGDSEDEHEVKNAMDSLSSAQLGNTEYLKAVNQLKDAWNPRYEEAVKEFDRFKRRVNYAREVSGEYIGTQERLTAGIGNPQLRARLEQTDAAERRLITEWIAQANDVIVRAEAIKNSLDDMNIQITKLELSATFAALYESFNDVPLALATLNEELEEFEQETERIYQTFGPKDGL